MRIFGYLLLLSTSYASNLQAKVQKLKAEDDRLVRFNTLEETEEIRQQGGCDGWLDDLKELKTATDTSNQVLVCELATLCLTDHPENRKIFAEIPEIHGTVTKLVQHSDSKLSAMAAHVIYSAVFASPANHQGFIEAGAVDALASVAKNKQALPLQHMWAAAALQNLAASYCDTEDDGRCYWDWNEDKLSITADSVALISDGEKARKQILGDSGLIVAMQDMICKGPSFDVFPGDDAIEGVHDKVPSIVAWAAAGVLKNLALLPEASKKIQLVTGDNTIKCLCYLSDSDAWLEESKASTAIHHMRGPDNNPCHFGGDGDLCIDKEYVGADGTVCSDAVDNRKACQTRSTDGLWAHNACCVCGGGEYFEIEASLEEDSEDDEEEDSEDYEDEL